METRPIAKNIDASIIVSWNRIIARAVDNTPSQKPATPNAQLTKLPHQKITDWVNTGYKQSH